MRMSSNMVVKNSLASAIAAVGIASLMYAYPAQADWQYTKWGMTPAEVTKASGGKAGPNADTSQSTSDETAKLTLPYVTGDLSFSAYFLFDNRTDKLTSVRLKLSDGSRCGDLYRALALKYGNPDRPSRSALMTSAGWRDSANNTNVVFMEIGKGSCSVAYGPLSSAANKGL